MKEIYLIYITTSCVDESEKIGKILVDERLAACVNIFSEITSFYRWNGKVEKNAESVLIAKTSANLLEKLEKRVIQLHSSECPCISAINIEKANKPFSDWIVKETSSDTNSLSKPN